MKTHMISHPRAYDHNQMHCAYVLETSLHPGAHTFLADDLRPLLVKIYNSHKIRLTNVPEAGLTVIGDRFN